MLFILPKELFFFLKIFKIFVLTFSVTYQKCLIKKMRLISKFMTSNPGEQAIALHILPNISRNKGNQTMKLSQLLEHNMITNFLEKSYIKLVTLPLFMYDFWRKLFLLLHFMNWSNLIVWLPLLRVILGNTCIVCLYFVRYWAIRVL